MADITPPARLPLRNAKWRLHDAVQVNRSGWTGTRRVVGLPGASFWSVTADFTLQLSEASARPWRGFMMALHGPANTFPVVAVEGQQTSIANPTVGTAPGAGKTLPLAGLPASAAVLPFGALMTVTLPSGHRRLVCLDADLASGADGTATASFWPELGEVPATGASVEIRLPFARMALTSDPPGWDVDPGQQYTFGISAEEAR